MSGSQSTRDEVLPIHTTGPDFVTRRFNWKIDNFAAVLQSKEFAEKQKFAFEIGSTVGLPTTWHCFLEHYTDIWSWSYVAIYFRLITKPENVKEVFASLSIRGTRPNGEVFLQGTGSYINILKLQETVGGSWGFPRMMSRSIHLDDIPLIDGALVLDIDFKLFAAAEKPIPVLAESDLLSSKLKGFTLKSLDALSRDYGGNETLTRSNADSATKIISRDKEEIPVNRDVLSARSSVFREMFQPGKKEAETGQVDIDDLSGKTIKVLLQYICTGTLDENWKAADVLEELVHAAKKYDLVLLTEFLDDVLGSVCSSVESAKKLFLLARKSNMKKAEKDLFVYIKKNAEKAEDLLLVMEKDDAPPAKIRKLND